MTDAETMTEAEALTWLKQVGGVAYHNQRDADGENAWVAVVRTPTANGKNSKIIMAFGESLELATEAAEEQWHQLWTGLSQVH